MKQTTLPASWNKEAEESPSSDSSSSSEEVKQSRAQPLQWTRVKSLEMIKSQRVMVYKAAEDLKFDKSLKTIRKEMDQSRGEFVFDPEDFKEVAKSFEEESYRLPEEGLLEYAKLATKLRRRFTEKAEAARVRLAALLADGEEEKVIVEPKLYRSSFKKTVHKRPHDLMLGFEAQFACKKRKKRTKKELSTEELKEILRLGKQTGASQ